MVALAVLAIIQKPNTQVQDSMKIRKGLSCYQESVKPKLANKRRIFHRARYLLFRRMNRIRYAPSIRRFLLLYSGFMPLYSFAVV